MHDIGAYVAGSHDMSTRLIEYSIDTEVEYSSNFTIVEHGI